MDSASETLRWIREAEDGAERNARINEVVQNGPDAARKALFDPDLPPQAAGFPTAEMREGKQRECLQHANPEAFETFTSVRKVVSKLTDDLERFYRGQDAIRVAALKEFDKWTNDS